MQDEERPAALDSPGKKSEPAGDYDDDFEEDEYPEDDFEADEGDAADGGDGGEVKEELE